MNVQETKHAEAQVLLVLYLYIEGMYTGTSTEPCCRVDLLLVIISSRIRILVLDSLQLIGLVA